MTYKERHAPKTAPPLPPWKAPDRTDEVIPESCGCPLPKLPGTSFCYDHAQNAELALDAAAVRHFNAMEALQRRSDLLKQAIHIARVGVKKIDSAPAATATPSKTPKALTADELRFKAFMDAALKKS